MAPLATEPVAPLFTMEIKPIGHIRTPYPTKFGVPRQPGLVDALHSTVVISPEFITNGEIANLHRAKWIWLIWCFSHNVAGIEAGKWSKTVRPPILGGKERKGVFSTRSSFRPNALAISSVKVTGVFKAVDGSIEIDVIGADLVDGTPIFQVMPYVGQTDCLKDANSDWAQADSWPMLKNVSIDPEAAYGIDLQTLKGIEQVLLLDPRPAYTRNSQPDREFWVPLLDMAIFFTVNNKEAAVTRIIHLNEEQQTRLRAEGTLIEFEKETA